MPQDLPAVFPAGLELLMASIRAVPLETTAAEEPRAVKIYHGQAVPEAAWVGPAGEVVPEEAGDNADIM